MASNKLSLEELVNAARIPGKEGLYFLGPYSSRITFYSQQVRALRLARALHQSHHLKDNQRIAVVGAGAAGATTAAALALLGHKVTLFDSSDEILHLQSGSGRLLHPHIYEWPQLGSLDGRAGLPILDWSAGPADEVVPALRTAFNTLRAGLPKLEFKTGHTLTKVELTDGEWALTFSEGAEEHLRKLDHVFLTMGFGDERSCGKLKPEDYWKPGAVGTNTTEAIKGTSYVVSGNGDGALTVILGLLIREFQHDAFTREFLNFSRPDKLRDAANSVFAGKPFGADVENDLRAAALPVLTEYGLIDDLRARLRTDRLVTVNTDGPLFSAGKASQLNQCMVLALLEAAKTASVPVTRSKGFVKDCTQTDDGVALSGTTINGVPDTEVYRHAVLRHGPNIEDRYLPAGDLLGEYKTHISGLIAANPDVASPPGIDDETYNLFETERIKRLVPAVTQPAALAAAAEEQRIVEITIDDATKVLIERGSRLLLDVAKDCEQLPARFYVDLHVVPADFPKASDLLRLARCSDHRIEVRAGSAVHGAWSRLATGIAQAPNASSARPISSYGDVAIADHVDACLVRLLTRGVDAAVAAKAAVQLGSISDEILAQVKATWGEWRATLDGAPALRFDFLRWLANVDQQTVQPWNGDHASLKHLVNALIMIAATHAGEALTPSSIANGNLAFAPNGVAIGTGCEAVGLQPLSSRATPEDWNADALILAAANEVIVADPAGTVMDGGDAGVSIRVARRVRPAIIQNDQQWRSRLGGPLGDWRKAVEAEFNAWRARQDAEVQRVSG